MSHDRAQLSADLLAAETIVKLTNDIHRMNEVDEMAPGFNCIEGIALTAVAKLTEALREIEYDCANVAKDYSHMPKFDKAGGFVNLNPRDNGMAG